MLDALKPGGYAVFTLATKHISSESSFATEYAAKIEQLIQRRAWSPVYHREFKKCRSFGYMSNSFENFSLLVFRKE